MFRSRVSTFFTVASASAAIGFAVAVATLEARADATPEVRTGSVAAASTEPIALDALNEDLAFLGGLRGVGINAIGELVEGGQVSAEQRSAIAGEAGLDVDAQMVRALMSDAAGAPARDVVIAVAATEGAHGGGPMNGDALPDMRCRWVVVQDSSTLETLHHTQSCAP